MSCFLLHWLAIVIAMFGVVTSVDAQTIGARARFVTPGAIRRNHPTPGGPGRLVDGRIGERPVSIYLPAGYDVHSNRRYPTLYLQDGQNVFERGAYGPWRVHRAIETETQAGRAVQVIVVGVHHGVGRNAEFTPPRANHPDPGSTEAHRYLDRLTQEVKPWIDRNLRTRAEREFTGIGGSSLGAMISLEAGLRHPDVFGRIMAMSPSLWVNDGEMTNRLETLDLPQWRLYLDSGGSGDNNDGVVATEGLRDILERRGHRHGHELFHLTVREHYHNEAAWENRFPGAFRALYLAD